MYLHMCRAIVSVLELPGQNALHNEKWLDISIFLYIFKLVPMVFNGIGIRRLSWSFPPMDVVFLKKKFFATLDVCFGSFVLHKSMTLRIDIPKKMEKGLLQDLYV